jgi:DNA-directed RNA polymerase subunit RPC12/RpoP
MKCLNCGDEFTALSVNQKYCCIPCGVRYRKKNRGKIEYPSISFECSQCGKIVITESGSGDMRTRFCCASCEKKFWRHPHWENPSVNIQFHSVGEYASYERRTNE